MLKRIGLVLLKGAALLSTLALVGLFILKAPQLHSKYLRNKVGSQVVMLKRTDLRGGGSGFFVKLPSGKVKIMTNAHICRAADSEGMLLASNENGLSKLVKVDEIFQGHDLCLVEGIEGFKGLSISSDVEIGEELGLLGHPKLYPLTFTRGQLIGYTMIPIMQDFVQDPALCVGTVPVFMLFGYGCIKEFDSGLTTIPAQAGNSGSPVVSFYGEVSGVLFAGGEDLWGIIVPLKYIQAFIEGK